MIYLFIWLIYKIIQSINETRGINRHTYVCIYTDVQSTDLVVVALKLITNKHIHRLCIIVNFSIHKFVFGNSFPFLELIEFVVQILYA